MKKKCSKGLSLALALALAVPSALPVSAEEQTATEVVQEQSGTSDDASKYAIYPIPQSIDYLDGGSFTIGTEVAIVAESEVDSYTKDYLKEVLDSYKIGYTETTTLQEGKMNILLGVEGEGAEADAVDTYAEAITISNETLYSQPDSYVLDAKENYILIEGSDTDSTYHGVATLKMMFSSFAGEKFLNAHIEDYATVGTRGYVEGFYGSWDWASRADLMTFARDYKMNSYVYAAKNDTYHTSNWGELYPDDMIAEIAKLAELGKKTKVEFAWSVHMGSFFSGLDLTNTTDYEARYAKLMAKFDQLYNAGVRDFDILNDDFGSGSNEDVVTVLNRINADFKTRYASDPVSQISYCPQGYNKSWSGSGAELTAMQKLADDIIIYWTGDDVNAPITQSTVNYLIEKTNHQPDFWLNYPVNEHATSGIFLGDITYYARDGVTGIAAFHSNPSRYPYASEVGLYQLAALVWNNNDYSTYAQEIWESAFDYLQPEVKDSYYTIAKNVSNAPNSSRVPGFNESEYLAETLATVTALLEDGQAISNNEEAIALKAEFENIISAVADFRENCANQTLVSELDPWLNSLHDVASAGRDVLESVMALEAGSASNAWNELSSASKYYDSSYTYENPVPKVAKAGSKRLYPFVTTALNAAKNQLTPILNPSDQSINPTFIGVLGGTERTADDNAMKMYDGNLSTNAQWQTNQVVGDYYGLDLGRVVDVTDITIVQGNEDGSKNHDVYIDATLQHSTDGENWYAVEGVTVSEDYTTITVDGLSIQARYVRYYLNSIPKNLWTYVREFTVNKTEEVKDRIYTNVETLKETPLTVSGTELSVRDLKGITLNAGEYVGVRLAEVGDVSAFANDVSNGTGLSLQYSYNEVEWKEVPTGATTLVAAKYLRLINLSNEAVTVDVNKIGMTLSYTHATSSVLATNLTNGLKEGSYDNLFDGDLSTYAWTNESQVTGDYITVDLGHKIKVYDVEVVTGDGNPRFYNAEIQISEDNATWTTIATVEGDNSVFEVPYRYVRANADGQEAQYLRIYITGNSGYYLKLHEISVNQTVEGSNVSAEVTSNLNGKAEAIVDGDISTLLSATATAGSYVEYRISENTDVDQISVVQGNASVADVYAVTPEGKKLVGTLSDTVNTFNTTAIATMTAVRVEWTGEAEVAIHELYLSKGEYVTTDLGEYVTPNEVEESDEEKPVEPVVPVYRNLALGKTVTVSGTSDGNKDNVNDGDDSTKWDSNAIKNSSGEDTDDAWVCIDLGADDIYEIDKIVVQYFNKIYPTSWVIETSDDAETWTAVTDVMTRENNGSVYPVETVNFETAISARYVRLYFNTLNTAAAGNGVGVQEFEIYGQEKVVVECTHDYSWKVVKEATCTVEGSKEGTCTVDGCGHTVTEVVEATGHTEAADAAVAPTCTTAGKKAGSHCSVCDTVLVAQEAIPATGHSCKTTTKAATTKADGSKVEKCTTCGEETTTTTINQIKSVTLSKSSYKYNGKAQKPSVVVKDSKGNKVSATNYTVKYDSGRKKVGKYKVTITFKGDYTGTVTKYFTINPKATKLTKATAGKKAISLKWSKLTKEVDGYQIQYATNKGFTKGKKVVTVKKAKTTTLTLKKLSAKKTYYVRIRTYKKVSGKTYYSAWSAVKKVKTK